MENAKLGKPFAIAIELFICRFVDNTLIIVFFSSTRIIFIAFFPLHPLVFSLVSSSSISHEKLPLHVYIWSCVFCVDVCSLLTNFHLLLLRDWNSFILTQWRALSFHFSIFFFTVLPFLNFSLTVTRTVIHTLMENFLPFLQTIWFNLKLISHHVNTFKAFVFFQTRGRFSYE